MVLKHWLLLGASMGLLASGCGIERHNPWRDDDADDSVTYPWSLVQESPRKIQPQVDQASDCSTVDTYVKQRMSRVMEASLRRELQMLLASTGSSSPKAVPVMSQEAGVPQGSSQAENSSPVSFTDTNNQIEGVEEPDGLKTDGTHFYHLSGRSLRISKTWPVNDMQTLATMELPGLPQQMLLTDDKKLVIFLLKVAETPPADVVALNAKRAGSFLPRHQDIVDVMTVDVSRPEAPSVLSSQSLSGRLTGARRVGDQVRLVVTRDLSFPSEVKTYMEGDIYGKSKQEKIELVEATIRRNKMLIHNQPVANLIKSSFVGSELSSQDCRQMFLPRVSTPLGVTDIHTFNLTTGENHVASLLSSTDGIHGAKDAVYLSSQHYWWNDESFDTNYLYVHKFSYDDAGLPQFRGTAGMEGNVLNQFSLDEYGGHLRVASTVWQRPEPGSFSQVVYNRVYVVKEYDGFLAVAGMTEPLAPGETIHGVRFAGELGYVVTFRRIDPLFVIGFHEPVQPVVLGELKIPGYSTYLHPLDGGLLLAVGEEIDEHSQMMLGNKISLFDVSDPVAPKERFKKILAPDLYTDSLYNHKSFKYHPATKTLALPSYGAPGCSHNAVCTYSYGVSLYNIDPDAGILDKGFLNMAVRASSVFSDGDDDVGVNGEMTHAVIADDVVFGVDSLGVKAAKLDAPAGQSWELRYN